MQLRIVRAALATALVAFIALPALAQESGAPAEIHLDAAQLQSAAPYEAAGIGPGLTATTLLPDERDGPVRLLTLVGPAAAIGVLTILGLTISIRALRHDLRQRRIVYRR